MELYAGRHAIGASVRVARSNGSWSDAIIVDYDATGEAYTVRVQPGGALKYLVEESELAAPSYQPRALGAHYEGRRVQVRGLSAGGGYEEALIRDYDAAEQTYVVEVLVASSGCGDLRRGVRGDQVRLRERV